MFASRFARAEEPKYADPRQVDADFALQGEYAGLVGGEGDKQPLGVQVIALGKGRYEVQNNVELPGERSTTAAPVGPGRELGPVFLQNHGCPLRYRNIWVVETH